MCNIKNHYSDYVAAEATLRRYGVPKEMPGFEYLRAGAVIVKNDGYDTEKNLLNKIENQCFVIKAPYVRKHAYVKQHMLEAIRAVSRYDQKLSIKEFLDLMLTKM